MNGNSVGMITVDADDKACGVLITALAKPDDVPVRVCQHHLGDRSFADPLQRRPEPALFADASQGCVIKSDRVDLIILGAECGFAPNFDELDWSAHPVENRPIVGVAEVSGARFRSLKARRRWGPGSSEMGYRSLRGWPQLRTRTLLGPRYPKPR